MTLLAALASSPSRREDVLTHLGDLSRDPGTAAGVRAAVGILGVLREVGLDARLAGAVAALTPATARVLLRELGGAPPSRARPPTERDPGIRRLVGEGLDDDAIAAALGVSPATVQHDRVRLGLLRRPTPAGRVTDGALREAWSAEHRRLGRPPTADELAGMTGLTRRSVQQRVSELRGGDPSLYPLTRAGRA